MSLKLFAMKFALRAGRKKSRKKAPWNGKQFFVQRQDAPAVETFLYEPKDKYADPMPVMFNIHGGAWVGGDATALDTQSVQMADTLGAFIVNINYKKLDVKPFPYPQEEVRDTVLYFRDHAGEYGLDVRRFCVIGYSAGGHICAGAAMLLRDAGFELCCQIPVYPFLDFHIFDSGDGGMGLDKGTVRLMDELFYQNGMTKDTPVMSPAAAPLDELKGLAPAELIICGPDALHEHGIRYASHLNAAGVDCVLKEFTESTHGFMEGNYPEIDSPPDERQRRLRDECFAYLKERLWKRWEDVK